MFQTRAPEAAVILIGTHIDKVTDAFLQRIGVRVKDRYLVGSDYMYQKEKGLPRILDVAFVSCTGGKGIDNLRQLIYTTASNLTVLIGTTSLPQVIVQSDLYQLSRIIPGEIDGAASAILVYQAGD